ncbi:hypothetical protein GGQ96_003487 [Sphingomonas abaci]|uniref:DUF2793 domain-containing protein n=2 Tax=Sphingomonas abaci TaxID=237611 RepID=A0A7W7AND3_9SPHN|nr:hypothetical protein [Sphingomonas abaci]
MATTTRLGLPLLEAGQAQKEIWHNEALALIDLAVQAEVLAVGLDAPPGAPVTGACWVVGARPTGAWQGQAGALAGWTDGGWRFVTPVEGMATWDRGTRTLVRYADGRWRAAAAVASPSGGATIDAEARSALADLLAALRAQGVIA